MISLLISIFLIFSRRNQAMLVYSCIFKLIFAFSLDANAFDEN